MHWRLKQKNKTMKYSLNIIVFLSFWNCFSQVKFDKTPENAKEIHFVYERKSNYYVNEKGVFADSLLLATDFPKMKFEKINHPLDSTKICGFVSFKKLNKENKKFLESTIYHTNEKIVATYFIPSKTTVFYVTRNDEEARNIFNKYFNSIYYKFEYRQEFNYNTGIEKRQYPRVNHVLKFEEIEKTIVPDDAVHASYTEVRKNVVYKNIVLMNENLSKFITPIIFTNNAFGVEKLESINQTIQLKSVTYN